MPLVFLTPCTCYCTPSEDRRVALRRRRTSLRQLQRVAQGQQPKAKARLLYVRGFSLAASRREHNSLRKMRMCDAFRYDTCPRRRMQGTLPSRSNQQGSQAKLSLWSTGCIPSELYAPKQRTSSSTRQRLLYTLHRTARHEQYAAPVHIQADSLAAKQVSPSSLDHATDISDRTSPSVKASARLRTSAWRACDATYVLRSSLTRQRDQHCIVRNTIINGSTDFDKSIHYAELPF